MEFDSSILKMTRHVATIPRVRTRLDTVNGSECGMV